MIPRLLQERVKSHLLNNKILILMGSKGVGKKKLILDSIDDLSEVLILDANIKKVKKRVGIYQRERID